MSPNGSVCHDNGSEHVRKPRKTHKNFEKPRNNFEKFREKILEKLSSRRSMFQKSLFASVWSLWNLLEFIKFQILRREKSFYGNFRDFFRSFDEVFRSFRKFFEAFGRVRTHSDLFGPAGTVTHSDAFGSIRKRLDVFEKNQVFKKFELVFDVFGRSFTKNFFHGTIENHDFSKILKNMFF